MKIALKAAIALTLCAFLLAPEVSAQTEPAAGTVVQPPPGIIVTTPPAAPSADTQQSCPVTDQKLELIG